MRNEGTAIPYLLTQNVEKQQELPAQESRPKHQLFREPLDAPSWSHQR